VGVSLDFRLGDARDLAWVGDQQLTDVLMHLVVEPPHVRGRLHDQDIAQLQVAFRPDRPFIQPDTPLQQDNFWPSVHSADDAGRKASA
jgi:hypothetical protein